MAQNVFINITLDPSAANKTEQNHVHSISRSTTANAGNVTFAMDSAVLTSMFLFESVVKVIRQQVQASGLK